MNILKKLKSFFLLAYFLAIFPKSLAMYNCDLLAVTPIKSWADEVDASERETCQLQQQDFCYNFYHDQCKIIRAAKSGNYEQVLYLLRNSHFWINKGDDLNNNTLLHHIAFRNMPNLLMVLIDADREFCLNLDFNPLNNYGQTPLDVAKATWFSWANKKIVAILYENGAYENTSKRLRYRKRYIIKAHSIV